MTPSSLLADFMRPLRNSPSVLDRVNSAIESLISGLPRNPKLLEAAQLGRLKITLTTVAQEAGVSRQSIYNLRDPELIERIRSKGSYSQPAMLRQKDLRDLRSKARQLQHEIKVRDMLLEASFRKIASLEAHILALEGKVVHLRPRGR